MLVCVVTKLDVYGGPKAVSGGCGFSVNVFSASWILHGKDKETNTDGNDNNDHLLNIYYVPDLYAVCIRPQSILTRPWEVDAIIICTLQI